MAFCDLEGDQDLAEAFLKYIFKFVLENCPEDLQKRIKELAAQVDKDFSIEFDKQIIEKAYNTLKNL